MVFTGKASEMFATAASSSERSEVIKNYEKWKKKYQRKKTRLKRERRVRKPEWQVEREVIARLVQRYPEINAKEVVKFSDLPLSKKTIKGLLQAQYRMPTEIQKQTIGLALQGKDILGAAKTGSGKTLAFIIPILECLYRQQWTSEDGLGILVISPTRELAYQTFEVLRKVGKNHEFSAGLVIGGKDLKTEAERIHRTNIVICTPGRLLQHMDETTYFHASDLQMLVLDEADRILDMGFSETMNAIVENLPKKRQTLLFSATQTKSVKDLARLSLKDPEYVWVHENAKFSTPGTLEQNYVVCELHQKINMLFSFVKSHLNKKIIVFFSSCKEVQYLFRVFCRLRPGIPILALYGKQQQMKRVEVYNDFCRKKAAVLFATDIAARGLDFPAVNWVLQLDCPEDANTYIHRVGRTARYKEGGEALLVLLPSEEKAIVKQLEEKKIPVNEIKINPRKLINIQAKLEAFLAQELELKERAQRCYVSYIRSVYLMKNKDVFDVFSMPLKEYAFSLGLAVAPRIRFLQKALKGNQVPCAAVVAQGTDNVAGSLLEDASDTDEELEDFKTQFREHKPSSQMETSEKTEDEKAVEGSVYDKNQEASEDGDPRDQNAGVEKDEGIVTFQFFNDDDDDDDDNDEHDLLTVKQWDVFGFEAEEMTKPDEKEQDEIKKTATKKTKVKEAKKVLKKKFKVNTKITFNEEGEVIQQWPLIQKSKVDNDQDDDKGGINVEKAKERLREEDRYDKEAYRMKIKEKHRLKRLKEKAERKATRPKDQPEEEAIAYLDQSDGEAEFDLADLPDPDKYMDSEEDDDSTSEATERFSKPAEGKFKRKRNDSHSSNDKCEMTVATQKGKRRMKSESDSDDYSPLDTGLSLAEDEELVLQLLNRN
ncbi:probable ATP-dependent RNA helicase DDX10 [Hemiscyllium ocellatum]|uniref:probable ATP-dependent RNA helicase DDX10 n=1 Tax=Hemiscyllium ocellatum TaxID=170820 RepID=UPI002966A0FE|nr:probable ATP-dependent RNA helicase DDX10 [Hemiscyllium ocellatum]